MPPKRNKLICISLVFLLGCVVNLYAQIPGCTDPLATNYELSASVNDGSCLYDTASVSPITSTDLPTVLNGNSGLIYWENHLWTHNDATDIHIYQMELNDITNFNSFSLNGTTNVDWEEIAQDEDYVYVGDIGNNANGNRTDLQLLRIEKNSLLQNTPSIDTISYSYNLQTDFTPSGGNNTPFDSEAFIVTQNQLYLFTKEWTTSQTSLYALPKTPGDHMATFLDVLDVEGLITAATFMEDQRLLVLTGYSLTLQPFLYVLYDFQGDDFFGGNKRKIMLQLPFHQVEGIATENGLLYYVSNELFNQAGITTTAKLHEVDLAPFLGNYLENLSVSSSTSNASLTVQVYPNPSNGLLNIAVNTIENNELTLLMYNHRMQKVAEFALKDHLTFADVSHLHSGLYFYTFYSKNQTNIRTMEKLIIE